MNPTLTDADTLWCVVSHSPHLVPQDGIKGLDSD